MRHMRPYKPAPKNASANRIRERYLHQLGLQRGAGSPLAAPPSNHHVVVISGLPSLPEDRATTAEHVMESHDFSISRISQHTGGVATPSGGSVDANSSGGDNNDDDNEEMSGDSGSLHDDAAKAAALGGDAHSHCSKNTLSVSPNNPTGEMLASMALAYPTSLRKVKQPVPHPPSSNNANTAMSMPWRTTSLSKPASVLLDSAEYHYRGGNDHDSVSSAGTSTTAESSLNTAAMMTRDWGAMPHSAAMTTSSLQGSSPASSSATGVYFQCGHPRLLGSHVHVGPAASGGQHCAASSLARELHRFNIDSDCEASVASNSVVDDHHVMMEVGDGDDAYSLDDTASHASVGSAGSGRPSSVRRETGSCSRKKKIGKTQRLMDRAVAHERILQIRSDRSQKMRASLVHSQRMGVNSSNKISISGLSSAMVAGGGEAVPQLSESPGSTSSSQMSALPLLHVQHGYGGTKSCQASLGLDHNAAAHGMLHLPHHSAGGGDLGRTPTASNCGSDLRKLVGDSQYLASLLPAGVHVTPSNKQGIIQGFHHGQDDGMSGQSRSMPLRHHPRLASRIPTPPPRLAAAVALGILSSSNTSTNQACSNSTPTSHQEEPDEDSKSTPSLQHMNHEETIADYDSVMEVALTLSKLGGGVPRTGPVPRFR